MIRDELRTALETLGGRLPGGEVVVLVRRAYGDRGVSFVRGDVEGVTGRPATRFEAGTEDWLEVVHPEDREGVVQRLDELPGTERLRLEYRVVQPGDGGVRWVRENLRTLRSAPGAPPEVVGLLTDATVERTVGAKMTRLEDELWRSRKLESVGSIVGSVSHDFNNLLTVILATTDLLRKNEEVPDDAVEDVRAIREAATRAQRLVRQILSFSSSTPGSSGSTDLDETVNGLEEILKRTVGERVRLSVETAPDLWPVLVDRAHMEQVIFNLTVNAGEAMPGGGGVRVEAHNVDVAEEEDVDRGRLTPGRYVRVTVRDTGPGLPEGIRGRVFEPFFTTKSRHREGGAGGFGLATVDRVVKGYGGAIRVETEAGRGTAFHVYFPVRDATDVETRKVRAAGSIDEPGEGGVRVLVVEDDPAVRGIVERILVRDGHSVVVVSSAGEGLQVFDRVRPAFDLLVTDVVLPDRPGPALHRALRNRVPDLPVIYMSGFGREQAIREGLEEGRGHFLAKPFTPGELTRAVDDVLEEWGDEPDRLPEAEEGGG